MFQSQTKCLDSPYKERFFRIKTSSKESTEKIIWLLDFVSPFSEHYLRIYYLLATEALAKLPVPVCLNTGLLPTSNNFMHCS